MKASKTENAKTVTVSHIARIVGCDAQTVRRYVRHLSPDKPPYSWLKFDESQVPEIVALCQQSRRRKCLNRFNTPQATESHQIAA